MFITKKTLTRLLVATMLLPIGTMLLFFFGRLALAFDGTGVSTILDVTAFVLLFCWLLNFVALVTALAINEISRQH
jgi:hypothetical protein